MRLVKIWGNHYEPVIPIERDRYRGGIKKQWKVNNGKWLYAARIESDIRPDARASYNCRFMLACVDTEERAQGFAILNAFFP